MINVSSVYTTPPEQFGNPLQQKTYSALKKLQIPFERVETDEAITMEDCVQIDKKLQMRMVKTLFLCNRQQSLFYLFVTAGDKPFKAKDFSNALGVARVSFAPAELMERMLGTIIGAATLFSALLADRDVIRIVLDRDVVDEAWYGCSDGTTTGYMKIRTAQIVKDFLPFTGHVPTIIEV